MELQVNSKIFYPSHGAGWIVNLKEIEFCGEKKEYYEFQFINNPITISTPVSNLSKLNIRETNAFSVIETALKPLIATPQVQPPSKDYNEFITILRELDNTGTLESFVKIIQYCNFVKAERAVEKRVIPVNITKNIKTAIEYIISELAVSEGISFEDAKGRFTTLTNIAVSF